MKGDILRSHPLFTGLPEPEIAYLVEVLRERSFAAGEILLSEGHSSEHFFIILSGEVEILKALGSADERCIALRGPGTALGEMSMFNQERLHTASVRAQTPVQALEMTRRQFNALLRRNPGLAYHLLGVISRRLEEFENATIQDLREKNRQLTAAYQELQAAQARLIEKEKLERELEIASRLQLSLLPQKLPSWPGFDFGALTIPAAWVGGDFYDFIPLGPDRIGIVVGDVCSKGIPAALFMTLTHNAMHSEALRHRQPGATLQAVNRRLLETNAADMYVTLIYGILDLAKRQFSYARAGHPRPLLLDCAGSLAPSSARPGQPVGLFEDLTLDEQTIQIPPCAVLLLHSDGLTEPLDQPGQPFDLGGHCQALLRQPDLSAQALCAALWQTVAGAPLQDDFTALAIRTL